MMIDSSNFDAETMRVRRVSHDTGVIRGFELQRRAERKGEEAWKKAVSAAVRGSQIFCMVRKSAMSARQSR